MWGKSGRESDPTTYVTLRAAIWSGGLWFLRMPYVVSVINDNNAFVGLRENKTDEVKAKQ